MLFFLAFTSLPFINPAAAVSFPSPLWFSSPMLFLFYFPWLITPLQSPCPLPTSHLGMLLHLHVFILPQRFPNFYTSHSPLPCIPQVHIRTHKSLDPIVLYTSLTLFFAFPLHTLIYSSHFLPPYHSGKDYWIVVLCRTTFLFPFFLPSSALDTSTPLCADVATKCLCTSISTVEGKAVCVRVRVWKREGGECET